MNGDVSFNGNNLQTYNRSTKVGINTNAIEHTDLPEKFVQLFAIANADESAIPDINYTGKAITIRGTIHGSSQADLDNRIDTFKGYFNGKNKNLDIGYSSGTRRYIATVTAAPIPRQQKPLYAEFTVQFICKLPFGIDLSPTTLWAAKTAFTSATFTETPTISGNAPFQLPVFTITINSLTGEGDYIQIGNNNNNQDVLLFGLGLAASDVIVIDCAERLITLNGNEVDYYGTFIELEPGASSITYVDGFDSRSIDIEGEYTKRWL